MNDQQSLGFGKEKKTGPVECLGMTFKNDEARREHFLKLLAEKLKDPEFRRTPGFPKASDDDILRLSDPPYYTACPNPFLEDFVRCYGKPYDPSEEYLRGPFVADIREGRGHPIYQAHSYHTKVPHQAIMRLILHYTRAGELVLDGFSGTGMIGVAAQMCARPASEFARSVEQESKELGLPDPEWGARHCVLCNLSPAATFVAAEYNTPRSLQAFEEEHIRILEDVEQRYSWMFETRHEDGSSATIKQLCHLERCLHL